MAMEIVKDHAGDDKHQFDADDIKALAAAGRRLKNSRLLVRLLFAPVQAKRR
jgi:hypothetical protein